MRVLGVAGSLRTGSYNRMLLHAARELAPETASVDIFDLDGIPLYNYDVEQEGDPEPVSAFKQQITSVDALLMVTPEYQQGVPGVLKNALDWASRPPGQSPMQGKAVAIMGASPGMTGTARAQIQLRQTLTYNNSHAVPRPEVLLGHAAERFDEHGRLTDERAAKLIRELLDNLLDLSRRLRDA